MQVYTTDSILDWMEDAEGIDVSPDVFNPNLPITVIVFNIYNEAETRYEPPVYSWEWEVWQNDKDITRYVENTNVGDALEWFVHNELGR